MGINKREIDDAMAQMEKAKQARIARADKRLAGILAKARSQRKVDPKAGTIFTRISDNVMRRRCTA